MKKLPLSVLALALAVSTSFAFADTITLGSFATGTTATSLGFSSSQTAMNLAGYTAFSTPPATATAPPTASGTASTFALAPTAVWNAALGSSTWVGNAATAGPGGTNPAYGYYQYTTNFTAIGGPGYSGSIDIQADDTAEVLLNGVVIVPFGILGSDAHCADSGVSCGAGSIFSLNNIVLLSGVDANQFTFVVEQGGTMTPGTDPSGVDFTANFAAIAPEPGSLLLLGTGMVGAAGIFAYRRRFTSLFRRSRVSEKAQQ